MRDKGPTDRMKGGMDDIVKRRETKQAIDLKKEIEDQRRIAMVTTGADRRAVNGDQVSIGITALKGGTKMKMIKDLGGNEVTTTLTGKPKMTSLF